METEFFGLSGSEFARFLMGATKGRPIVDALVKIDDPLVARQVLCASIDTWCGAYNEDPIEFVEDMLEAMRAVHSKDNEEEN